MTLDAEGYACERGREAEEHEIPVASLFGSKHHVIKSVLPVYTTLFLMSRTCGTRWRLRRRVRGGVMCVCGVCARVWGFLRSPAWLH